MEDEILQNNPEDNGTEEKLESTKGSLLERELESVKAELSDYKDKYVRAFAEMDNMRKRLAKDKQEIIRYGSASVLKDFLQVYDSIEKSIKSAVDLHPEDDGLIDGLKMIEKLCLDTLKRHGVLPIEAKGLPFDPNFHEAMLQVDSDEFMIAGMVVDEYEKGFKYHDRVLRPAKVSVSKGGN